MKHILMILALFPAVTFAVDIDALIAERAQIKIVLAAAEADWDSNRVEEKRIEQRVINLALSKEQIQKQVERFKVRLNEFKANWTAAAADKDAAETNCITLVIINAGRKPLSQEQKDQCDSQMMPIDARITELRDEFAQIDLVKKSIQNLIDAQERPTWVVNTGKNDLITSDAELTDLRARMSQRLAEINSQLDGN